MITFLCGLIAKYFLPLIYRYFTGLRYKSRNREILDKQNAVAGYETYSAAAFCYAAYDVLQIRKKTAFDFPERSY